MDDRVECIMITANLDLEYHAISYVWGSSVDPREVLVNGHNVKVTNNLHSLLKCLRRNGKVRQFLLWIDALCINQEDLDERAEQVQIMGSIYAEALNVHIWMGLQTEHTQNFAQQIAALPHYLEDPGTAIATIVDNEALWDEFCRFLGHEW